MLLLTETIQIQEITPVANVQFSTNTTDWEIVNNQQETACMELGGYHITNLSETSWMFYHRPFQIKAKDNFMIKATFELLNYKADGHYGLVWGFDSSAARLNRMVIAANSKRFGVMHFERKFSTSLHRIYSKSNLVKTGESQLNTLVILKIGEQLYLFINRMDEPVLVLPEASFPWLGNQIGFYTEPGIDVRVKTLDIALLQTEKMLHENWKKLLDSPFTMVEKAMQNERTLQVESPIELPAIGSSFEPVSQHRYKPIYSSQVTAII